MVVRNLTHCMWSSDAIMAVEVLINNGSCNGLVPHRHQAII